MKSLIKSNDWLDIGEVHAVDWSGLGHIQVDGAVPARSASPSAPEKRENELEALRKALAEADARHKEEIVRKSEQARLEAAAQHRRDDEAALAALSQELTRASDETLQRFASAEHLALMMCEAALSKLLSDATQYKALLERAIRRQVEQLRSEMILKVRVSAADFPDRSGLLALQRTLGGSFDIAHDPELQSGACRLDLRLGHIDLSLPAYRDALQTEFRRLTSLEGRP